MGALYHEAITAVRAILIVYSCSCRQHLCLVLALHRVDIIEKCLFAGLHCHVALAWQFGVEKVDKSAFKFHRTVAHTLIEHSHKFVATSSKAKIVFKLRFACLCLILIEISHAVDQLGIAVIMHHKLLGVVTNHHHRTFAVRIDAFLGMAWHLHSFKEVFAGCCIVVVATIPPFGHTLKGVGIGAAIHQHTALLHPLRYMLMCLGIKGFHIAVGHQQ